MAAWMPIAIFWLDNGDRIMWKHEGDPQKSHGFVHLCVFVNLSNRHFWASPASGLFGPQMWALAGNRLIPTAVRNDSSLTVTNAIWNTARLQRLRKLGCYTRKPFLFKQFLEMQLLSRDKTHWWLHTFDVFANSSECILVGNLMHFHIVRLASIIVAVCFLVLSVGH